MGEDGVKGMAMRREEGERMEEDCFVYSRKKGEGEEGDEEVVYLWTRVEICL